MLEDIYIASDTQIEPQKKTGGNELVQLTGWIEAGEKPKVSATRSS